jgi:hypothetical protein
MVVLNNNISPDLTFRLLLPNLSARSDKEMLNNLRKLYVMFDILIELTS